MQITIAAVGRDRAGPYRTLFETFRTRCLWPITLVEIPVATAAAAVARRNAETLRLARAVAGCDRVISLDASGRLLDSEGLAETLGSWRDEGSKPGIVIGGPDGLDPELLPRIDLAPRLRPDDLAAPAGPGDADRAAVPRVDHPRRPSVSSALVSHWRPRTHHG